MVKHEALGLSEQKNVSKMKKCHDIDIQTVQFEDERIRWNEIDMIVDEPKLHTIASIEDRVGDADVAAFKPVTRGVGAKRRREPLRLKGMFAGVKIEFMCDTGAESSIISERYLEQLSREQRKQFQDRPAHLVLTNGQKTSAFGPVLCDFEVNGCKIKEVAYAADIEDDAILGWDAQIGGRCCVSSSGCGFGA